MKSIIRKHIALLILGLLAVGCVQSVENPYTSGDTDNNTNKPVININSPESGESIHMGITPISYQAADYQDGPGLAFYNLFVDGTYVQSFQQNADGSSPYLYFNTDSLEKKLGIDPYNWPNQISYAMTVVNLDGEYGETPLIDSIYVNQEPVAPGNLVLTRTSDKSFNLFWDNLSSNETKYEVWRQDGNNNPFLLIQSLQPNTISTNDIVNSDYIDYGYKVRTVNSFGNSEYSNIVYSSGVAGGDTPTNLIGEALGATTIQLNWEDRSDTEDGFVIERTSLITGLFERLVVVPRNTTEYFDYDLYPLATYTYRVASYKTASLSAWSNSVIVSTYDIDVMPPQFLQATYDPLLKSVAVSWDDRTPFENGTVIERKETINSEFIRIGSTTTDVHEFFDANIVENQLYYYRARFTTTGGFNTPYSNVDTAFVYDAPPNAPSNLQIIEFSSTDYSLWWDDNSDDEEGFEIWRKVGNTGTYVFYKELLPNTTAYNEVVASGAVYYYKVRAFRNPQFSAFSNEVNTDEGNGGEFPTPSSLSSQIVNGNEVRLSWVNNATDELQIIVERKLQNEMEFSEVKILAPGTTTWTDNSGLTTNFTLYYRLKAKYSQGESEYTNELMVYIP